MLNTLDIFSFVISRVQQITGCTNNVQRRSGTVLPPPADDCCSNSSPVIGKHVVKISSNVSFLLIIVPFATSPYLPFLNLIDI